MKKILIIHNEYKKFGGEDSVANQEIDLLSNSFKVEVLKFSNNNNILINTFNLLFSKSNPISYFKTKKVLETFKPDVAYVHNTWFTASNSIFSALRKNNVETFIKIHNFRIDCLNGIHYRKNLICHRCNSNNRIMGILFKCYKKSYFYSFIISRYSKKLNNSLKYKNIKKILVLSNFHKKYFEDLGFNSKKIQVLNNSVKSPILINEKPSSSNNVVFVGRISEEKGILDLLKVWQEFNEYKLKIIGDGPLFEKLNNSNKNENVLFLGFLSQNEIYLELSKARALIFPTKLYEGQGMVPSEASIIGVPVISPNLGGMKQLFPEKNYFMYEPNNLEDFKDKIYLLRNNNYVDTQGLSNRKYTLNKFAEESNNSNILNIFNNSN